MNKKRKSMYCCKKNIGLKTQKKAWKSIIVVLIIGFVSCVFIAKLIIQNNAKSQISFFIGNAVDCEMLQGVQIEFIPGYDNFEEKGNWQAVTGADGKAFFELPHGEYTVKWYKNGYYAGCQNMEIKEDTTLVRKWLLPYAEGNSVYIFAEWESGEDFDLCVYNEQTAKCIGKEATLEDVGNFLYDDNGGEKRYELVYLEDGLKNSYTIYVKNCDGIARVHANGTEEVFQDFGGVKVSIYAGEELLYQKETNGNVPLWKCAYLSNGEVEEQDESIYNLKNYAWAERDKNHPTSWTAGAEVKAEEVYSYDTDGELKEIDRTKFDLNGNWIIDCFYESNGQRTNGFEREYDENGCLLVEYYYSRNTLTVKSEYEYDESGREKYSHVYDMEDEQERLMYYTERTYDAWGNQTAYWSYDSDGVLDDREEWEYDQRGNELFYYRCNRDGKMFLRTEHQYDAEGREVVSFVYDDRGLVEYRTEYQYDSGGMREIRYCYDEGVLIKVEENKYNGSGKRLEYSSYDENGVLNKRWNFDIHDNVTAEYISADGVISKEKIWLYDAEGKVVELNAYKDNELLSTDVWEYNERGETIFYYEYNGDGSLKYKREYDYVHEYDAIGGTETVYCYINGRLETKTIILYY